MTSPPRVGGHPHRTVRDGETADGQRPGRARRFGRSRSEDLLLPREMNGE
ncbi:hypothetical protein [Streptomyces dangxiongensis]|nr:hypothetical protein [Streptomyces dangxiongensis]